MAYDCIFKTAEEVDHQALLAEFEAANPQLTPACGGQTAWTGLRVFDLVRTDRLDEFPVLSRLIEERFGQANVAMVNFYNLSPTSALHEHRDQSGNLLFGISRVHMPLKTNDGAILTMKGKPHHLGLGEVWCLDTSGRHSARNDGAEDRIHLVIDVKRAPETVRYFPRMSAAVLLHLARFCGFLAWRVAWDLVTRPRTIMERLPALVRMIGPRLRQDAAT